MFGLNYSEKALGTLLCKMPVRTEVEVLPRDFDGPFVQRNKTRIASDGSSIVPIVYFFHKTKHFAKYGWYLEESIKNGRMRVLHNPDGIALVKWYFRYSFVPVGMLDVPIQNSIVKEIKYYQNDQLHRENGPAEIIKNFSELWRKHGVTHRFDGPSYYSLNFGSADTFKYWIVNGLYHRINGPAKIDIKRKKNSNLVFGKKEKKKYKQEWRFLGKKIPKNIVKFEHGKPWVQHQGAPLDRKMIMDAMLFNRRYGKIVQAIYSMNRMVSEKEAYEMIME